METKTVTTPTARSDRACETVKTYYIAMVHGHTGRSRNRHRRGRNMVTAISRTSRPSTGIHITVGAAHSIGAPPYAFPAYVPITALGFVSDAHVGRIRWNNPLVLKEPAILLGELNAPREHPALDPESTDLKSKRMLFGDKSFFVCRSQGARAPTPIVRLRTYYPTRSLIRKAPRAPTEQCRWS